MAPLFLTESEVDRLLDMPAVIQVVENAFRALALGEAENVPRRRCKTSGAILHTMSAAAHYLGLVGWKQYTTTRQAATFHVGVSDQKTGLLIALMEADRLGQLRTGATTGVAVKHLAAPAAEEVGILGSGWQAQSQLEAVSVVRPIKTAKVFSPNRSHRDKFADSMSQKLGIMVTPVSNSKDAVADMPIVITATNSVTPVLAGEDVAPGSLVCAMGSNWLHKTEIDEATVRRAGRIVCDSIDACKLEAGDFIQALGRGNFDWSRATELSTIVQANTGHADSANQITLFKSVGMAIEDVATAALLVDRSHQDHDQPPLTH